MPNPAAYYAVAAQIYKFWLANGFSPAQAAGLLAQADAESSLNPKAVGDHDTVFGVHHGTPPRRRDQGRVWRRRDETAAARRPAQGGSLGIAAPQHAALAKIKAAKTAYDAGFAAARFSEMLPGSTLQYQKRGDEAEAWATYFSKHPVTP